MYYIRYHALKKIVHYICGVCCICQDSRAHCAFTAGAGVVEQASTLDEASVSTSVTGAPSLTPGHHQRMLEASSWSEGYAPAKDPRVESRVVDGFG